MTPERWQQIKSLVNSALEQNAEDRAAVLQQSCADDLPLRRGAEALLSFHQEATRRLEKDEQPFSAERWQQIEKIFLSALDLDPAKRAAFLAEACGDDELVRHEVESLLVYQAGAGGLIGGAIEQAAGLLADGATMKARFTPGTTLNKRYRIIGSLGRGGMGEVYRADDLKLGHPVALKFLTEKLSKDKAMLARFHSEVSMAHRVTHPNVCRVHDIGEVTTSSGNLHFLSMEYVDGEDLSSLLRRIGRLPADKAVEIANQLCAGLAAAHEAGVLHRDLKPANVMLDGKGRVRITDFGLAGFAEQMKGQEVFAGTPAYMSPEQFAGKEVTTKSDIYALGLVLYEIFTGKRVFEADSLEELKRLHESSSPTNPSSWVKDIDPLVERVILRCLEKEPAKRLASAKQVADALPGGDPLAAALALGETPSPEMVAAAGGKAGLRPAIALSCLFAIIAGLLIVAFLSGKTSLVGRMQLENSPEVLANKAREIISRLGYAARPVDTAYGFNYDTDYLRYARQNGDPATLQSRLLKGRPAVIRFWYRESPQYLEVGLVEVLGRPPAVGRIWPNEPPQVISGMASAMLDPQGRLISFSAVPPQIYESSGAPPRDSVTDWMPLFSAAGLDAARFTPTEPQWTPLAACDVRAAWRGVYTEQPEIPFRIEAAAYRGRPVYFQMISPWTMPDRMPAVPQLRGQRVVGVVAIWTLIIPILGGSLLAWHNVRRGRGDRRGAFKLMVFGFSLRLLQWLFEANHTPTSREVNIFFIAVSQALLFGVFTGMCYLALEPYVRRRWPQALVSWSRLLEGRWRDPLVGRDILVGVLFAISIRLVVSLAAWLGSLLSSVQSLNPVVSLRSTMALLMGGASAVFTSVGFLFLFFLFRSILRRQWLAAGAVILLYTVSGSLNLTGGSSPFIGWLDVSLSATLIVLVLMRFGLMAMVTTNLVTFFLRFLHLTTDLSVWYAWNSTFGMAVVMALASYAFYTSLGGQKVFAGKLLEE